jgi:hypothetical protein
VVGESPLPGRHDHAAIRRTGEVERLPGTAGVHVVGFQAGDVERVGVVDAVALARDPLTHAVEAPPALELRVVLDGLVEKQDGHAGVPFADRVDHAHGVEDRVLERGSAERGQARREVALAPQHLGVYPDLGAAARERPELEVHVRVGVHDEQVHVVHRED